MCVRSTYSYLLQRARKLAQALLRTLGKRFYEESDAGQNTQGMIYCLSLCGQATASATVGEPAQRSRSKTSNMNSVDRENTLERQQSVLSDINAAQSSGESQQDSIEQVVLERYASQALRVPVVVLIIIALVLFITRPVGGFIAAIIWASVVLIVQFARGSLLKKLALTVTVSAPTRLKWAALLSLLNGLTLAGLAILFIYVPDVYKAIFTMILVGMSAGAVATTTGCPWLTVTFNLPIMLALVAGWLFTDTELSIWINSAVVALILMLWGIFQIIGKDLYLGFGENFDINKELQKAVRSAETANAAKSRFLAAASHDLRQPVHALSLLAESINSRSTDNVSKDIIKNMNVAMATLRIELDSLLEISQHDAGILLSKRESFSIRVLCEELAGTYAPIAEKEGLTLVVRHPIDDIILTSDKDLLGRLLRNLLDNAIKYTFDGKVVLSVELRDSKCALVVCDSGIGIDENQRKHIYDEFFQISNPGRNSSLGLGLGLSIVNRLVTTLDAKIELASTLGKGSVFTVLIPNAQVAARAEFGLMTNSIVGNIEVLSAKRVLVVDENEVILAGADFLIQQAGCTLSVAESFSAAGEKINQEPFGLVLCALALERVGSGVEFFADLQRNFSHLPIIVVSEALPAEQQQVIGDLGVRCLVKPVPREVLLSEMVAALN